MTVIEVSNIQSILLDHINQELYEDGTVVEADDDLLLEIEMDSLTLMRLIGFIENEFDLSISPALVTIQNFRTVTIMSEFLNGLMKQNA